MAISAQRIEKVKLGFQAQTGGIDPAQKTAKIFAHNDPSHGRSFA